MKTLVVALHQAFPAVRLSDYVIMPDHVHYLMICDYETNQAINPLWVSFVLMEAVECARALNGRGRGPRPPEAEAMLGESSCRGLRSKKGRR